MGPDFLGFRFSPLVVEDRPRVYRHGYAIVDPDTLLVSSLAREGRAPCLLQPVGQFPGALQGALLSRARGLPEPLHIESVSAEFLERHAAFARHFEVAAVRDGANYVYAAADLADLPGRRYAGKRNLVAQASRHHTWTVEPLDPARAGACLEFGEDIASRRTAGAAATLEQEQEALACALRDFGPLGLQGLLVRVDGRPSAFSIFDRLDATTAVVLFERARRDVKGLYQVINRETARLVASQGFVEINREEDLGDPGLRKAKLSYHPTRLEMKHALTLRS